ncbi:MAG: M23 family metallopeptidase [Leptospiraceae bacterium]|nr:M23 family metallopeptidase [Leptospiraceae bacterium]
MNLGYTTGNPGDNVRLDLGLNYDYRDNSYGASATIIQDFQNADPYFNKFNTSLNWNSQNGFSNNINYTLSQSAADGMTKAMTNNWKDVLSGVGYMFGGRDDEEGSLLQDMFGNTDEYKVKKYWASLSKEEKLNLLMMNVAPRNITYKNLSNINLNLDYNEIFELLSAKEAKERRNLKPGDVILHKKGADKWAPVLSDGRIAVDENGRVKILSDDDINFNNLNWDDITISSTHSRRLSDGRIIEQPHRADISTQDIWGGPNTNFKVLSAYVKPGWGGTIEIELPNGEQIRLLHFDGINSKIWNAQGSGSWLAGNTFLGTTSNKIGYSTGKHLHIESMKANNPTKAIDILYYMRGGW